MAKSNDAKSTGNDSGNNGAIGIDPQVAIATESGTKDAGTTDAGTTDEFTDDFGTKFDADKHRSDDAGNPIRNKDGSFRKQYTKRNDKKSKTENSQDISDLISSANHLSETLMIFHSGLAVLSQCPELEIDKGEAEKLSEASLKFMSEFDIKPNPKAQAAIALIVTAGSIYGPRIYLISDRKKNEKIKRAKKKETENKTEKSNGDFDVNEYLNSMSGNN